MFRHLQWQDAFEMLVPFFDRIPQEVKYDNLFTLRKDHKYNPMARDAQAGPWKQY